MKLVTYRTPVNYRVFCLQLRILIQKLPSIIFAFISNLRLPRVNFLSPMFRVWFKWWYLIAIMSYHAFLALVARFFLTVGLRLAVTPLLVVFLGLPRFFAVPVTTVGTE